MNFANEQKIILKQIEPIDLDMVTKPSMKSFAPGTLDFAAANGESMIWGVSASLWKGSSGGPCIVLDGEKAGGIIGLGKSIILIPEFRSLHISKYGVMIFCRIHITS